MDEGFGTDAVCVRGGDLNAFEKHREEGTESS